MARAFHLTLPGGVEPPLRHPALHLHVVERLEDLKKQEERRKVREEREKEKARLEMERRKRMAKLMKLKK